MKFNYLAGCKPMLDIEENEEMSMDISYFQAIKAIGLSIVKRQGYGVSSWDITRALYPYGIELNHRKVVNIIAKAVSKTGKTYLSDLEAILTMAGYTLEEANLFAYFNGNVDAQKLGSLSNKLYGKTNIAIYDAHQEIWVGYSSGFFKDVIKAEDIKSLDEKIEVIAQRAFDRNPSAFNGAKPYPAWNKKQQKLSRHGYIHNHSISPNVYYRGAFEMLSVYGISEDLFNMRIDMSCHETNHFWGNLMPSSIFGVFSRDIEAYFSEKLGFGVTNHIHGNVDYIEVTRLVALGRERMAVDKLGIGAIVSAVAKGFEPEYYMTGVSRKVMDACIKSFGEPSKRGLAISAYYDGNNSLIQKEGMQLVSKLPKDLYVNHGYSHKGDTVEVFLNGMNLYVKRQDYYEYDHEMIAKGREFFPRCSVAGAQALQEAGYFNPDFEYAESSMPDIEIEHQGYKLQKMAKDSPLQFEVGEFASCCQHLGGASEDLVLQIPVTDRGDNYYITHPGGRPMACMFVFGTADGFVIDSVEATKNLPIEVLTSIVDKFVDILNTDSNVYISDTEYGVTEIVREANEYDGEAISIESLEVEANWGYLDAEDVYPICASTAYRTTFNLKDYSYLLKDIEKYENMAFRGAK